jgi:KUP system potassium uptake protein
MDVAPNAAAGTAREMSRWFPLLVGAVIATLMLCWRKGSLEVRRRLYEMSILPLDRFLTYVDDLVIGRAPGLGVWLTKVSTALRRC